MALINGIYVFIDEDGERVEQEYELSSHPVEDGEAVADHLRPQPFVIKLQGEVVGPDAAQKLAKLRQLAATATPVTYAGRNYDKNMLITRFDTGHPGSVMAGLTFEMELKHGRFARNSYVGQSSDPRQNAGTQQIQENSTEEKVYYTVKAGDTIWDLVAAPHAPYPTKTYGFTCSDVIARNSQAFSISGDPTSMQVGARLWVGNRRK